MTRRWYARAKRIPWTRYSGQQMGPGNTRKMVLHAEGVYRSDPDPVQLAHYLNSSGVGAYHLIIALHGKHAGTVVQMLPADKGAYSMVGGSSVLGWSTNRQGARCIQVCVAGVKTAPDWRRLSPKAKLAWLRLIRWVKRKHGVPMTTPKGVRWDRSQRVSSQKWARRSGVFHHGCAPQNDHTDGPGEGKPLGVVRAGKRQRSLVRMINRIKRR